MYVLYNIFPKFKLKPDKTIAKEVKDAYLITNKFNIYKGAEIIKELAKEMPDHKFIFLGNIKQDLKMGAPTNIKFLGYLSHEKILYAMKNAKALLVPSLGEETFGMVAVESLLMGTPVIASKRGGLQEIVVDEKNGFLVEPSVTEFKKAILKMDIKKVRYNLAQNTKGIKDKFKIKDSVRIFEEKINNIYK